MRASTPCAHFFSLLFASATTRVDAQTKGGSVGPIWLWSPLCSVSLLPSVSGNVHPICSPDVLWCVDVECLPFGPGMSLLSSLAFALGRVCGEGRSQVRHRVTEISLETTGLLYHPPRTSYPWCHRSSLSHTLWEPPAPAQSVVSNSSARFRVVGVVAHVSACGVACAPRPPTQVPPLELGRCHVQRAH